MPFGSMTSPTLSRLSLTKQVYTLGCASVPECTQSERLLLAAADHAEPFGQLAPGYPELLMVSRG